MRVTAMDDGMTIFGTISLRKLIQRIETATPDGEVRFDFCGLTPSGIDSYRGYYDHLAIGWKDDSAVLVSDFLAMLRGAIGATFTGWKGGDFVMDGDSPVWVANRGHTSDTAIVDVLVEGEESKWVHIVTARIP